MAADELRGRVDHDVAHRTRSADTGTASQTCCRPSAVRSFSCAIGHRPDVEDVAAGCQSSRRIAAWFRHGRASFHASVSSGSTKVTSRPNLRDRCLSWVTVPP